MSFPVYLCLCKQVTTPKQVRAKATIHPPIRRINSKLDIFQAELLADYKDKDDQKNEIVHNKITEVASPNAETCVEDTDWIENPFQEQPIIISEY